MGFLFASGNSSKKTVPAITGLQIQTAVNVLPIPIGYGCPRVPINIIYVNGFGQVAPSGDEGKGLLSGGKGGGGQQETKYQATFIGALGEGQVGDVLVVFDNQAVYAPTAAPPGKVAQLFNGSAVQAPWSTITSRWPADAFGYKNTAYIGFGPDYQLDSSATIPQLNFVVQFPFVATMPLNLYVAPNGGSYLLDADPAYCVHDFLTNIVYGIGFPEDFIDLTTVFTSADGYDPDTGDAALSTYCQAVGFGWSLILNNAEPGNSILERWFKNLGVAAVWTGSILKFIPYWDSFSEFNPGWSAAGGIALKYFQPNVTTLFDLTDDDFVQVEEEDDPVVITRIDPMDVYNVVRVDFKDRGNIFNPNVSEAKDDNYVEIYGERTENLGLADEFTHGNYAATAAQIRLQRNISVRNIYSFKLDWRWCILDPMDIVTITDTTIGLLARPVRIQSIEEDEKGILSIVAEDFRIGANTATAFPYENNSPPPFPQTNVIPGAVNEPVIFEPTAAAMAARGLTGPVIAMGVSAGPLGVFDPNWGGANIWVSNDNVSYALLGLIRTPSPQGVLTDVLADFVGSNPDTTGVLQVSLVESAGVLNSYTPDQAVLGASLCVVVDTVGDIELLSYETATLTAPNTYDITGLYRGLYGTVPCEHLAGSQFLFLTPRIFTTPLQIATVGSPLWFKFQSFNIFNQAVEDLGDSLPYIYYPVGTGIDPNTNPLAAALIAGNNLDFESIAFGSLDLNLGGGGPCAPISFTADLGVL